MNIQSYTPAYTPANTGIGFSGKISETLVKVLPPEPEKITRLRATIKQKEQQLQQAHRNRFHSERTHRVQSEKRSKAISHLEYILVHNQASKLQKSIQKQHDRQAQYQSQLKLTQSRLEDTLLTKNQRQVFNHDVTKLNKKIESSRSEVQRLQALKQDVRTRWNRTLSVLTEKEQAYFSQRLERREAGESYRKNHNRPNFLQRLFNRKAKTEKSEAVKTAPQSPQKPALDNPEAVNPTVLKEQEQEVLQLQKELADLRRQLGIELDEFKIAFPDEVLYRGPAEIEPKPSTEIEKKKMSELLADKPRDFLLNPLPEITEPAEVDVVKD